MREVYDLIISLDCVRNAINLACKLFASENVAIDRAELFLQLDVLTGPYCSKDELVAE